MCPGFFVNCSIYEHRMNRRTAEGQQFRPLLPPRGCRTPLNVTSSSAKHLSHGPLLPLEVTRASDRLPDVVVSVEITTAPT